MKQLTHILFAVTALGVARAHAQWSADYLPTVGCHTLQQAGDQFEHYRAGVYNNIPGCISLDVHGAKLLDTKDLATAGGYYDRIRLPGGDTVYVMESTTLDALFNR